MRARASVKEADLSLAIRRWSLVVGRSWSVLDRRESTKVDCVILLTDVIDSPDSTT